LVFVTTSPLSPHLPFFSPSYKTSEAFSCDGGSPLWAYLVLRDFFSRRPNMGKKLYVGNLSYATTDSDLHSLFQPHGTVQSAQVIMDRDAGRSKGFGFVEMDSGEQAQAAINALNGQEINGRALTVNEARPREERGRSRDGFGGGRR
jgi:cold-inducible RNA-binding protein